MVPFLFLILQKKKSEIVILLTLPKLGKPSCFPIYPKSQMWCDSGVVFEFLVTGVLLAKWKHLLHWSKTNPSCSKWSPLHFSKIASGHSAWRVHAMPTRKTASLPHTHTHTYTDTHGSRQKVKYTLCLIFIIFLTIWFSFRKPSTLQTPKNGYHDPGRD